MLNFARAESALKTSRGRSTPRPEQRHHREQRRTSAWLLARRLQTAELPPAAIASTRASDVRAQTPTEARVQRPGRRHAARRGGLRRTEPCPALAQSLVNAPGAWAWRSRSQGTETGRLSQAGHSVAPARGGPGPFQNLLQPCCHGPFRTKAAARTLPSPHWPRGPVPGVPAVSLARPGPALCRSGQGGQGSSAARSHLPALATAISCARSKPSGGPFQTVTLRVLFPKGSSSAVCMQNG